MIAHQGLKSRIGRQRNSCSSSSSAGLYKALSDMLRIEKTTADQMVMGNATSDLGVSKKK
jgi:hypothetical protein